MHGIEDYKNGAFPELNEAEAEKLATRSMIRTPATLDLPEHAESNTLNVPAAVRASERFKQIEEIGRIGRGSV